MSRYSKVDIPYQMKPITTPPSAKHEISVPVLQKVRDRSDKLITKLKTIIDFVNKEHFVTINGKKECLKTFLLVSDFLY